MKSKHNKTLGTKHSFLQLKHFQKYENQFKEVVVINQIY